jgi:NitT/TauT family transport system permease protein
VKKARRGAVGFAVFLIIAELAGRLGLIDPAVLPLASTVLATAGELAVDSDFLSSIGSTMTAWATGMLLAVGLIIPLGILFGSVPGVERALRPIVEFMRPIPSVALIPLVLLVLRDNFAMEVSVIVYAATWPILINTMYAIRDADPVAKETLRSFGFGELALLRHVVVPSAVPFIMTGVRLSASIALIVAISTELFTGGASGLGVFLIQAGNTPDGIPLVIAAALWAGVIGWAINAVLVRLDGTLLHWHHAHRSDVA